MDPAGTHNDNGLPFGSQALTIPTTGGTPFIADNIDIDKPVKIITGTNEVGVPYREVLVEDAFTGNATLQLPTATTPPPNIGDKFTVKEAGGASLNCKVSKTGSRFKKDGETLIPIEFRKQHATN